MAPRKLREKIHNMYLYSIKEALCERYATTSVAPLVAPGTIRHFLALVGLRLRTWVIYYHRRFFHADDLAVALALIYIDLDFLPLP